MEKAQASYLTKLTHWGVESGFTATFAKRIILTNFLAFLFAANMFLSLLAFLSMKQLWLAGFTLFIVLTLLCWPLLNSKGHFVFARVGLIISSNLLGFLVSVLLPGSGYNHGFFVMAGIPILIFGLHEKPYIILGLILPMALYPLSEWLQWNVPAPFRLELSRFVLDVIHYSTGTIYVALIFLMFLFISRENSRAEAHLERALEKVEAEKRKIEELNQRLEEQRIKAFSSAKFAALGEMAGGIAHEINNPMTAINLNTQHLKYLLKGPDFEKEQAFERLEVINRTVHRVASIIEAMKSFSREATNDSFELETVKKIIDDTLTFCSQRFKNHQIKLVLDLPAGPVSIRCRSVQICQVLLNLLNNAFDAVEGMPEKWIRIEVAKARDPESIIIAVSDSGPGVPPEVQENIFQPFYSTKPVGKGTGLGLSLSRRIAQDHRGALFLDKASPVTRFVLEFPV